MRVKMKERRSLKKRLNGEQARKMKERRDRKKRLNREHAGGRRSGGAGRGGSIENRRGKMKERKAYVHFVVTESTYT
jgi:hypothetical protein